MKRQTLLFVAAMLSGIFSGPAQAQVQQQEPPDCGRPPYAAQTAEVSARATAQFQISLARVLQDQLKPASETGGTPGKVSLTARVASAAAAGFAATALGDTLDNYFCRVLNATTEPQKRRALEDRQILLKEALRIFFNPALYNLSPALTPEERTEDREFAQDEEKGLREQLAVLQPLVTVDAVGGQIPEFNHSVVTIRELLVEAKLPVVSADVCLGMVRKSIRAVDPAVLVALDKARANYLWWISGNPNLAAQDFKLLAAQIAQRTRNNAETETQTVTPQFQTCLSEVEQQASAQVSAAVSPTVDPASQPVSNGQAASGAGSTRG